MKKVVSFFKISNSHWLLLIFFISTKVYGQNNLVPNPSFENYIKCPILGDNPPPPPWYMPTSKFYQDGTYNNSCSSSCTSVPYNCFGSMSYQPAKTGQGYVSIGAYSSQFIYLAKSYQQVFLKDSLQKNKKYYAEFFVSLTNIAKYGCNNIGMLFTDSAKYQDTLQHPQIYIAATPQIVGYGNPIVTDTLNWVKISGIFKAKGKERFITIGNFNDNNHTQAKEVIFTNQAYYGSNYYVDDVSVIPLDSFCLKADAGADITIKNGDSAFIGSYTNGIDSIRWFNSSGQLIDSVRPGFYVKPSVVGNYFYIVQQTVNGCSSRDTVFVNVTVPLRFTSFSISQSISSPIGGVRGGFETANEVNVSHFNIQRSLDGRTFETVGKVKAQNQSSNTYSFTDDLKPNTQYPTPLFYRIEAIDKDGKKTYSETKKLNINHSSLNVAVFPNPAKDYINIASAQTIQSVEIINHLGQIIHFKNDINRTAYSVNLTSLPTGLYFVKVLNCNTGALSVQKVILQ